MARKQGEDGRPYDRGLVSRAILSRPRQCEISSTSDVRARCLGLFMHHVYVRDNRRKKSIEEKWYMNSKRTLVEGILETSFLKISKSRPISN